MIGFDFECPEDADRCTALRLEKMFGLRDADCVGADVEAQADRRDVALAARHASWERTERAQRAWKKRRYDQTNTRARRHKPRATAADAERVLALAASGASGRSIASETGLGRSTIGTILKYPSKYVRRTETEPTREETMANSFTEDGILFRNIKHAYRCKNGHYVTVEPCFICHCNKQRLLRAKQKALAKMKREATA